MRRLAIRLIRVARAMREAFPFVVLAVCVVGMWLIAGLRALRRNPNG